VRTHSAFYAGCEVALYALVNLQRAGEPGGRTSRRGPSQLGGTQRPRLDGLACYVQAEARRAISCLLTEIATTAPAITARSKSMGSKGSPSRLLLRLSTPQRRLL